jgi:DNA-binding GntR family transcriptional regulator
LTLKSRETHPAVDVLSAKFLKRHGTKASERFPMKYAAHRSRAAAKSSVTTNPTAFGSRGSSLRKRGASFAQRAYFEIRNKILKGDLPVGAAISRRKLAEELNISVPPVMEALQQLEREGLVESKPRVGTRVRILNAKDVEDRTTVREALETQAARLFAARATREEKRELKQMGRKVDQLYAAFESNSADREFLFSVNTYHMKLHLRIAECARCPALRDAIEKEQVLIFNWLYDTAVQRRNLASNHHARLADALATGTPDEADRAMRHHIRTGLKEVLAGLQHLDSHEKAGWRRSRQQRKTS